MIFPKCHIDRVSGMSVPGGRLLVAEFLEHATQPKFVYRHAWRAGDYRWTRNAAVLAIAGYLETYIAQIATAATESSPALLIGGTNELDGLSQLKRQPRYDLYKHVEPLVRGNWQSRISAYRKLFKDCPYAQFISQLEGLRKLRNNSGHAFGRDIDIMRFADRTTLTRLPRISNERLQAYLGLAEAVALAIENHLGKKYVGAYEVLKVLHRWLRATKPKALGPRETARKFLKHFATLTPHGGYGIETTTDLVKAYEVA